jgi:hypothetical protein
MVVLRRPTSLPGLTLRIHARSPETHSLTGAEAILRLRALLSSGDFDEYWAFHEAQEKKRNHTVWYKDGVIPDVLLPRRPGRPRFQVVK